MPEAWSPIDPPGKFGPDENRKIWSFWDWAFDMKFTGPVQISLLMTLFIFRQTSIENVLSGRTSTYHRWYASRDGYRHGESNQYPTVEAMMYAVVSVSPC